ncbi:ATP-binding protein [Candidatus Woesearchaeota archaeon]|nr:ATP-binding protein [Candidatus Woesearchaeota archaeon]
MCSEQQVMTLVKEAKIHEKNNTQEAAKKYLEAAKALLELSSHHPEKENEYIDVANRMYTKAKKLKANEISNDTQGTTISKPKNDITFSSIAGLEELKQDIRFKIIEPLKNPELFAYYHKTIGGGVLMYGPPGCGKTLIAKATANEAKATFIHVKSSDIKSKFVGETEKNIAELFAQARKNQPSIIFFDEFEALGGDRAEGLSHERSAVAQLLTEMDGVDSGDQQILLLAATNEPWAIDAALRREGRFGTTIFIPPPDLAAREQILQLQMQKRPTEKINFSLLGQMTEGFSGADLKAASEYATNLALKESLLTGKKRKITQKDMEIAITKTQSVLRQWFAKAREQVVKKKLEESFKELVEKANQLKNFQISISSAPVSPILLSSTPQLLAT